MSDMDYEKERQKKHIEVGVVLYQDSEKEQLLVATLELFGNGFDITIYEDNEPKYVNRCVVREVSCEFLQYTEDYERVIVKVNNEIFVMTEEQFNIIKDYYEMLFNLVVPSNFKPINHEIGAYNNSPREYFDEEDELYYVYEEILKDLNNVRLRTKLAFHLMEELQYFNRIETIGGIIKYASLCEQNLKEIIDIKTGKDKKMIFLRLVSMSQLGLVHTFRGELDDAVKTWYQVLEFIMNSNLKNNFIIKNNFIGAIASNIQCILKYLDEGVSLNKFSVKYSEYIYKFISGQIEFLEDSQKKDIHDEKTQQYIIDKITKIKRIKELNDHIFIVSLFDDDFESLFEAGEDPDFDSYSFQCATMKNIYDDLKNGIYRPVFEKDEATINRQKMRIRAYL